MTVNLKKYYQVHNVPEGKQNTCGFQVRVFARTGATAVKLASFYAMWLLVPLNEIALT